MRIFAVVLLLSVLAPVPAMAQQTASARLVDGQGRPVGEARLTQTRHSGVLLHLRLHDLPAGAHALHVHAVGRCDAPDFEGAGPHLNPGQRQHGLLTAAGPHAGDLPNVFVGADGTAELELLAGRTSLRAREAGALLDEDGSALVLHAAVDDHRSDPAGAAGARIACGVIERAGDAGREDAPG